MHMEADLNREGACLERPTSGIPLRKAGQGRHRPLCHSNSETAQTEKEEPQPQVVLALGLRTTNWAPSSPSVKSTSDPIRY